MTFPATPPPGEPSQNPNNGNGDPDSRPGLPRSKKRRSRLWLLAGVAGLVVLVSLFLAIFLGSGKAAFKDPTFKVVRKKLVFSIVEAGSLESADNNEYVCRVKAKSQSGVATTIKWLIDDGTMVRGPRAERVAARISMLSTSLFSTQTLALALPLANPLRGQKLIELDDSSLQENLTSQSIEVNKAEAENIQAEEDYKVTLIDNENKIRAAFNELLIAKLNLEKYLGKTWQDDPGAIAGALAILPGNTMAWSLPSISSLLAVNRSEGDYQASYQEILGKIELASGDRDSWLERASWSRRMWKLGFMSKTQADGDQSRLESAVYSLTKLETDRQILERYDKIVKETDLRNQVEVKYRNVLKTRIETNANQATKDSARRTKKSTYEQQVQKKKDIEEEIGKCKMYASKDGLAVYYIPESTRGGFGKQSLVQVGENVSEGQKLVQIPDLTRMLVNTRVHEAMVSHVKKYQEAHVRIFAHPGKVLKGHVTLVKNAPSAQDWLSADVKVYQTMVAIDDNIESLHLKPGLSAEVTIFADESSGEVLQIPIQSVVGNIQMGENRKCFVLGPDGQPQMRDIVVGMNNDKVVEVREGLKEGEEVIVNPMALLTGENRQLKPGVPQIRQQNEGGGDGGVMKGGKGKGKAKAAPKAFPGVTDEMKAKWEKMSPEQRKAIMEKFKNLGKGE